jgi:hypothetical protein
MNPDYEEKGYNNRIVALQKFSDEYVIRVVYEKLEGMIRIITIYPGRKERYEKNKI